MIQIIKIFSFFPILLASSTNMAPSNDIPLLKGEPSDEMYYNAISTRLGEGFPRFLESLDENLGRWMLKYNEKLDKLFKTRRSEEEQNLIKDFIDDLCEKLNQVYKTSTSISKTEGCATDSNTTPQTVNELDAGTVCDPFVSLVSNHNGDIESFITKYSGFIWKYISEKYNLPENLDDSVKSNVARNSNGSVKNNAGILDVLRFMKINLFVTAKFMTILCKNTSDGKLSEAICAFNYEILSPFR